MMPCAVCSHPNKKDIDDQLLSFSYQAAQNGDTVSVDSLTLESIAKEYNLRVQDLQVHAFMHLRHVEDETSIVQATKLTEIVELRKVIDDFSATMSATGKLLRSKMQSDAPVIPKGSVELYLGAGNGIRQIVNDMVDANMRINGEGDDGLQAIAGLFKSIKNS